MAFNNPRAERIHASGPIELLESQNCEIDRLLRRIAEADDASERRRLLHQIIETLNLRRVLSLLLKSSGPPCERCLAHHARMNAAHISAILDVLSRVIVVRTGQGTCPDCHRLTRLFFLPTTHSRPT